MQRTVAMKWLGIIGLCCLMSCSKKENVEQSAPTAEAQPASVAAPIDPATVASITGTVKFEGPALKAPKIDMSTDAGCKGTNTAETMAVDGGNLANVFVYVKDGLGNRSFDVPKEQVTVDQNGCRYVPHVVGVVVGQTIEFKNSDPTTHNIHPAPKNNREWNESQQPQVAAIAKTFSREEIMLPVKCNQHPWMRMYLNVVKHPFYAVTGKDGKYKIKGLPPGDYTLAFVHEKLGEQEQRVTLVAKDNKNIDASFKAD